MFTQFSTKTILHLIIRVKSHLSSRRKKQYLLLFFFMIALSFAEAISLASIVPLIGVFLNPEIIYSYPIFDNIINFFEIVNNDEIYLLVTVVFLFLAIISGIIRLFFIYFSNKVTLSTEADFKTRIFSYNINQSYSFHLKQSSNLVMSALIQKTYAFSSLVGSAAQILSGLIVIAFILGILIFVQPYITFAISSFIAICFVIVYFSNRKKIMQNSKEISMDQNNIVNVFQDSVGYSSEVIIYSLHKIFISKFDESAKRIAKNWTHNKNVSETPRIYLEYLALISLGILIFVLNQNQDEVVKNFTVLAALGLGAQKILPWINRIFSSMATVRGNYYICKDALDLLDLSKRENIDKPISEKIFLKESIKLKNIYFSYKEDHKWILKNFNLEIKKGSIVGVKGPTGCGKSTLGKIIIGLLNPTKGRVLVDDVLINNQNVTAWQKNISIIPQGIFLNDVSIAENIAIGVDPNKINIKKVKDSAKQAQIADFIESIPNQYEEKVGERGMRLSGGQQQRIGIARALYREAKVILFDEATNQLDADTESQIMQSINNLNKETTIIFIAHSLSTLKICDQIIDFSKFEEK